MTPFCCRCAPATPFACLASPQSNNLQAAWRGAPLAPSSSHASAFRPWGLPSSLCLFSSVSDSTFSRAASHTPTPTVVSRPLRRLLRCRGRARIGGYIHSRARDGSYSSALFRHTHHCAAPAPPSPAPPLLQLVCGAHADASVVPTQGRKMGYWCLARLGGIRCAHKHAAFPHLPAFPCCCFGSTRALHTFTSTSAALPFSDALALRHYA